MDIHRCRFVPYPPSMINALAFSQSQASREIKADDLRLAIGRANGDIEIWNPLNGAWLQETIFRGGKDRSIDGLVWIKDPDVEDSSGKVIAGRLRLFSIGYSTTITEWDLEKGQPLRQSSGNHGEIWCLAAQPLEQSPNKQFSSRSATAPWQGQNLITGCTDGAVVLYSTEDQNLKLQRVLVRPSTKKAKVISIVFQERNIVVAGCTDSTIRIYDIRSGSILRSMSLGGGPSGGPKETIVWAIKCLPNRNIISGDSAGELRIWDGKTYTLVQRIKSHRQDILSLATSVDGTIVFSGGMDRRTVVYKQIGGPKSRWAEVTHRRFHSHDVKTMATFEGKGMSIVASAGPDASPVIVPLREFGMENHRTLPCLPQEPVVQSSAKKRLFVSWWDREIHIWHIKKTPDITRGTTDSESEFEERIMSRELATKIIIKGEANISSTSITSDGSLLAVSTPGEIKIFRLNSRNPTESHSISVSKLKVPSKLSSGGARHIRFSPDGHWLCVIRRDNRVESARVLDLGGGSFRILPSLSRLVRLDRKVEERSVLGGLGAYNKTINRMSFSSDSRILAVSDLAGYIDTWVLEGQEDSVPAADDASIGSDASLPSSSDESDSDVDEDWKKNSTRVLGQQWKRNSVASLLPKLSSAAVVLAFRPITMAARVNKSIITPIPHPVKEDPPRSEDLSQSEDRLIIVTAAGKVHEFEVFRGAFSDWSRRNPMANFPEEFRGIRDQVMGCVWDLEDSKERLWLYGSNWMWMFDLSRDFPANTRAEDEILTNGMIDGISAGSDQSHPRKKRKRGLESKSAKVDLRNGTSGAGSKIPDSELVTGISRKHQKFTYEKDNVKHSTLDHRQGRSDVEHVDADEDLGEDSRDMVLERAQRGEDAALFDGEKEVAGGVDGHTDAAHHWWHTYKYRPIMGIVPIDGDAGLEVVLVERPTWEMDLPPRYYGDQDWEKPGL